jgi:hypothetical protein
MELTLLIKSVAGLVLILGILVFLLVLSSKSKKAKTVEIVKKEVKPPRPATDLPTLRAIVKNKKSSAKELQTALDLILKYHGDIHPKLGTRTHPEYDTYMEILFTICRHPHTNKNIILSFNRELERKNPDYKIEINEAITKGLNSRGA